MPQTETQLPARVPERLAGRRVCICAGPGGVGKTTVSAALALGLAARGDRVVVVTIDPARRLATALGLEGLGGRPHRVDPLLLERTGLTVRGELWAMMLDPKGTFDELVESLAPDEATREEVFANHIYRELSSAVAGSQEFTAVAKLHELHEGGDFDVIVLDTPPSREALDFLSAPGRLSRFIEGRALGLLRAPGGLTSRLLGRGTSLVLQTFGRLTGVDLAADLSGFFGALGGMIEGFHGRAEAVDSLLRDPSCAFLIVTAPAAEPAREARYLAAALDRAGMSREALVVNGVHPDGLDGHSAIDVEALLGQRLGEGLAGRLARNLADFDVLARRDREVVALLGEALAEPDPILLPLLDGDVHDLAVLARLSELLLA